MSTHKSDDSNVNAIRAESGLQVLARLNSRPNISLLEPYLFPEGSLNSMDVIEIRGGPGSGKTILATHLLARCILSKDFGGTGAGAIFIDTEHHFQITQLVAMLEESLRIGGCKSVQTELKAALQRLTILSCFESTQLKITLQALSQTLAARNQVSLLVFDSPSTFYWPDSLADRKPLSKNKYLSNILSAVLNREVLQQNVILAFTVADAFITPPFKLPVARHPNANHHKVILQTIASKDNQENSLFVATLEQRHTLYFKIKSNGIIWTQ